MYAKIEKPKENKSRAMIHSVAQREKRGLGNLKIKDNRKNSAGEKKMLNIIKNDNQRENMHGNYAPGSSMKNHQSIQRAHIVKKNIGGVIPHWEVVLKKGTGNEGKWEQIGFANPTGLSATSGSASTKTSSSSSGIGGRGMVHRKPISSEEPRGSRVPKRGGSYELIFEDKEKGSRDNILDDQLPEDKKRIQYSGTTYNCQHFVTDNWKAAGLNPDPAGKQSISKGTGKTVNRVAKYGTIGTILGVAGLLAGLKYYSKSRK